MPTQTAAAPGRSAQRARREAGRALCRYRECCAPARRPASRAAPVADLAAPTRGAGCVAGRRTVRRNSAPASVPSPAAPERWLRYSRRLRAIPPVCPARFPQGCLVRARPESRALPARWRDRSGPAVPCGPRSPPTAPKPARRRRPQKNAPPGPPRSGARWRPPN